MQGVCAFFSPFPSETHSKPAVPGDAEAVCAPAFRSAGEGALKLPEARGEGEGRAKSAEKLRIGLRPHCEIDPR